MPVNKKLVTYVHVDGEVYGPDSDVPAEVAKQITNPKAWGDKPEDDGEDKKPAAKKAAASSK